MTLLPSLLVGALAPAVLFFVAWLPAVAVIAFVSGVAGAGAQLALFDQMLRTIPHEHGVTFNSVDQSVANGAIMIAPVIGGFLAVAFGVRMTLLVVAALGLAAFILFAIDARARSAIAPAPRSQPVPIEP
jgi:predicted MFS family arabinose efflux permease